ncbi:MAG TPA: hypothetical protein VNY74_00090 [Edaphobacter sp.]|nr:hypothetical protein [Edaphobacter sp.]
MSEARRAKRLIIAFVFAVALSPLLLALHLFFAFSAQKSHVKPWKRQNPAIKIGKPNKPNPLHAKNKSAKLGILVSLNSLK